MSFYFDRCGNSDVNLPAWRIVIGGSLVPACIILHQRFRLRDFQRLLKGRDQRQDDEVFASEGDLENDSKVSPKTSMTKQEVIKPKDRRLAGMFPRLPLVSISSNHSPQDSRKFLVTRPRKDPHQHLYITLVFGWYRVYVALEVPHHLLIVLCV